MKYFPLILILLSFAVHLLPAAEGTNVEKKQTAPDISAESSGKATKSKGSAELQNTLKICGFPNSALAFEPALAAAMSLTQEQTKALTDAYEETIGAAQPEIASEEDKKLKQRTKREAQKEFASRRDMILTGAQISLIETLKTLLKESTQSAKASKDSSGKKELFLSKVKTVLSPEQLALVEAAGGKLP